jgi:hypothetical protein
MGRIGDVEQHCDGGLHLVVSKQWQYGFGFRWPFDEDDIGLEGLECLEEATGRARAVVADAKEMKGEGGCHTGEY